MVAPTTTVKEEKTTDPRNDAPAMPLNKLLCTVSTAIGPHTHLPSDGVCNLVFYDSLSKDQMLHLPEDLNGMLETFRDYARGLRVTEAGMSLPADCSDTTLTSESMEKFRLFWDEKIYHFGVLNMHSQSTTWTNIKNCLDRLKLLYQATAKYFFYHRKIYTVLGIAPDYPLHEQIANTLRDNPPSLVIFLTHVSFEDTRRQDCRMLPASVLKFPNPFYRNDCKYGVSIMEVMSYIHETQKRGIHLPVAISFTMRGHFYKPKYYYGREMEELYQPFYPCQNFYGLAYLQPHMLCKNYNSSFGFKMDELNVFAFNWTRQQMVMFDNDFALTGKLCRAVTSFPQVRFGIAAYDVTYDVGLYTCPKFQLTSESFGRVKTLGMVLSIAKELYASKDKESCLRLFGKKAVWNSGSARSGTDGKKGGSGHAGNSHKKTRTPLRLRRSSKRTSPRTIAQRRPLLAKRKMSPHHGPSERSRMREQPSTSSSTTLDTEPASHQLKTLPIDKPKSASMSATKQIGRIDSILKD